jgi:hypothetical protein
MFICLRSAPTKQYASSTREDEEERALLLHHALNSSLYRSAFYTMTFGKQSKSSHPVRATDAQQAKALFKNP